MNKKYIFVIEHLEKKIWPWCLIEYKHISDIVGKRNLWFTNIKNKKSSQAKKLSKYGITISKSARYLNLNKACVLDPESPKTLNPRTAKKYRCFIFGGILGSFPPKKRTKSELTKYIKKADKFNIGKKQMSTDNAVYVVKKILNNTPLKKIRFKDEIEIKINKIESTILPYRCALVKNKPLISKELIRYLKKQ